MKKCKAKYSVKLLILACFLTGTGISEASFGERGNFLDPDDDFFKPYDTNFSPSYANIERNPAPDRMPPLDFGMEPELNSCSLLGFDNAEFSLFGGESGTIYNPPEMFDNCSSAGFRPDQGFSWGGHSSTTGTGVRYTLPQLGEPSKLIPDHGDTHARSSIGLFDQRYSAVRRNCMKGYDEAAIAQESSLPKKQFDIELYSFVLSIGKTTGVRVNKPYGYNGPMAIVWVRYVLDFFNYNNQEVNTVLRQLGYSNSEQLINAKLSEMQSYYQNQCPECFRFVSENYVSQF